MSTIYSSLFWGSLPTLFVVVLAFLSRNLIIERLKTSLQKELEEFKADLLWDQKIRQEASKVAEYLALARDLDKGTQEDCRRATQLSWELAMWLPEDIYKAATTSLINRSSETNELSTVISVRRLLLKEKAGNLTQENVAHHALGIGKK